MLSGDIASRAGTPQNLSCLLAQGYLARVLARLELSLTLLPPWAAACAACRSRRSNTDCCTKFARYGVPGRVFYVLLDPSHMTGWEGEVCFEWFAAIPHRCLHLDL